MIDWKRWRNCLESILLLEHLYHLFRGMHPLFGCAGRGLVKTGTSQASDVVLREGDGHTREGIGQSSSALLLSVASIFRRE